MNLIEEQEHNNLPSHQHQIKISRKVWIEKKKKKYERDEHLENKLTILSWRIGIAHIKLLCQSLKCIFRMKLHLGMRKTMYAQKLSVSHA